MRRLFLLFMFAPLLLISSCEPNEEDQIVCTQEFVYGLNVVVLDSETGNPIFQDIEVKATDGAYQETLQLIPGLEYSFAGAGERIGTYTITVTKVGYQTYTSSPIVVTRNVCHVITQGLTLTLHPE